METIGRMKSAGFPVYFALRACGLRIMTFQLSVFFFKPEGLL